MKKSRGFVLMEAIVVITVLCVILVTLYGAFSKILIDVKSQSLYDNTEYIYKTAIVRKLLEDRIDASEYVNRDYYIFCNDTNGTCQSKDEKLKFLKVRAVYITRWNIDVDMVSDLEATTQKYIKSMDYAYDDEKYRIIVMFDQENNSRTDKPIYEYASLIFGSRG